MTDDTQNTKYNDITDMPHLLADKSEIFGLIDNALEKGASDIHLSAGNHPVLRVNGKLFPILERPKLTPGYVEKLVGGLIDERQHQKLQQARELDFSYIFKDRAFLRGNVFYQRHTEACVIRIIPAAIRSIDELNLPPVITTFAGKKQGLILVTGPTGSGKSSTIAAILNEINRTRNEHILTIEDPIEYVFKSKQSIINQREVHRDTLSFSDALKSALREDFNVLLIGELRDIESIEAALTIAETGHLVFASIHAGSAALTPDRIINAFPPYYQSQIRTQLANVLVGIVAQRLLPAMDGGRIPAIEVMLANDAVKSLIRENKTSQLKNVIETSAAEGMITFEQSLKKLLSQGKISEEVVRKIG